MPVDIQGEIGYIMEDLAALIVAKFPDNFTKKQALQWSVVSERMLRTQIALRAEKVLSETNKEARNLLLGR